MSRVLVTGGSGFIGSHVVDALAGTGVEPRIFDRRPSPHHDPGAVETVIGDILEPEALEVAMEGCDAVIHLAAAADVGAVAEDPRGAEQNNARGTMAVLEAARATGLERVIYGSTIWVYRESGSGLLAEEAPLGFPAHLYTATKLAGEMYCASYAELYGLPFTILRFGIPYGPRARPAAVIPTFVDKALKGEPLTIAGDGLQTRRFVYVEDLADGVARSLDPRAENRVYNLASDETVTVRELAEVVGELVGDVEIVHVPGRKGDFGGAQISSARAEKELGWRAQTPIREGVRRYLDWLGDERETRPAPATQEPPEIRTRASREQRLRPAGTTALAYMAGMVIPLLLGIRTDDFGQGQLRTVAITTLVTVLSALCALTSSWGRSARTASVAGLMAFYTALLALPWSRHALALARPHMGTIALSAIGALAAMSVVVGVDRMNTAQEPAPDQVS